MVKRELNELSEWVALEARSLRSRCVAKCLATGRDTADAARLLSAVAMQAFGESMLAVKPEERARVEEDFLEHARMHTELGGHEW